MLYLHLVSLESDLFVSESYNNSLTRGKAPAHHQQLTTSLASYFTTYSSYHDQQRSRLGICGVLYLHGYGTMFYVVCTVFGSEYFCRMANIIDYLSEDCMRRRAWTPSHLMMVWWTFLLPRPRVAILGMLMRKIPLFSTHPAIPPSGKMFICWSW